MTEGIRCDVVRERDVCACPFFGFGFALLGGNIWLGPGLMERWTTLDSLMEKKGVNHTGGNLEILCMQ